MNGVEANLDDLVRSGAFPQWAADEARRLFLALRDTVVVLMPYWGGDAMGREYARSCLERFMALFDSLATLYPAMQSVADGVRSWAMGLLKAGEEAAEGAAGIVPNVPTRH